MPLRLNMHLSNGNYSAAQLQAHIKVTTINETLQKQKPTSLTAPMIGRVHNVRPGCGSCGR